MYLVHMCGIHKNIEQYVHFNTIGSEGYYNIYWSEKRMDIQDLLC